LLLPFEPGILAGLGIFFGDIELDGSSEGACDGGLAVRGAFGGEPEEDAFGLVGVLVEEESVGVVAEEGVVVGVFGGLSFEDIGGLGEVGGAPEEDVGVGRGGLGLEGGVGGDGVPDACGEVEPGLSEEFVGGILESAEGEAGVFAGSVGGEECGGGGEGFGSPGADVEEDGVGEGVGGELGEVVFGDDGGLPGPEVVGGLVEVFVVAADGEAVGLGVGLEAVSGGEFDGVFGVGEVDLFGDGA